MTDPGVLAPIHKNKETTLPKISNFYNSSRFVERNLSGKIYQDTYEIPTGNISHWELGLNWETYTFDEVVQQDFQPVVGRNVPYGPTWYTHWFKVTFDIPTNWIGKEVRFRWATGTESTLWDSSGRVLQGLSSLRTEYILTQSYDGTSGPITLYLEVVVSRIFGAGGVVIVIDPPSDNLFCIILKCELVTFDREVYSLTRDLEVIYEIANELGDDSIGYMAMHTANQMVNSILMEGNYTTASQLGKNYLAKTNGERAHNIVAIGNCHIDTAWLWPYSETKRKVARSFSNQLRLLERTDVELSDYTFVASQAQQWEWLKFYYLDLFDEVKTHVAGGRFIPVGMTWVEMDGNMPSGESFIRQFFFGNKFYKDNFNHGCKEFWLPDTFGYSGQIPGLMKHVGLGRFLTQKLSWNTVNKFPHQNFKWEGIDGSTVIAHFPPGENYTMSMTVAEVKKTVNNLQDKGRVNTSAFLYGYGDGGGGPTEDMIQRAYRMDDTDGIPKVAMGTPDTLFTQIEASSDNLMTWVGELFLEFHNGTYTSQADIKKLNRNMEFNLRDSEFLLSSAVISLSGAPGSLLVNNLETLEGAWKNVLVNQFHDVLPGSSIELAYTEAKQLYADALTASNEVYNESNLALFGTGLERTSIAMNTLQWPRREVIEIESAEIKKRKIPEKGKVQKNRASTFFLVDAPAFGYGEIIGQTPENPVTYDFDVLNNTHTISNGLVEAVIESGGQLKSLKDLTASNGRDLLVRDSQQKYGNQITLYDDEPVYWDAWDIMDYHLETFKVLNDKESSNIVSPVTAVENSSLAVVLEFSMNIGDNSTLQQSIILKADTPYIIFDTEVYWDESHRVLKTGFDSNLLVRNASFDIQFGYIQRPTHMNTSWDSARYEVCGHKWADLSEPNAGMTVLNDSKYGWSARGNSIYLTLLKAPQAPDFNCDTKETHYFKYAVMPHTGNLQEAEVMRRSYEFNNPLRLTDIDSTFLSTNPTWSLFDVQGSGIVLHTIKPTDDASGDIILRFFESNGSQSKATITIQEVATSIQECDGLENIPLPDEEYPCTSDGTATTFDVSLTPFKIFALRIKFFTAKYNAITKKLKEKK